jgi:hypothetical protein
VWRTGSGWEQGCPLEAEGSDARSRAGQALLAAGADEVELVDDELAFKDGELSFVLLDELDELSEEELLELSDELLSDEPLSLDDAAAPLRELA